MPGGGAPAGSSGTGAGQNANVYNPMAQPQADQQYQNIISGLLPMALDPTLTPAGQNYPTAQVGAGMVSGNPYFDQLTQYANQTVPYGAKIFGEADTALPQYDAFASNATAMQNQISPQQGFYPSFLGAVQSNPYLPQALSGQDAASSYGGGTASGAYQAGQNALLDSASVRNLFGQQTNLANQIPDAIRALFGPMVGQGNQVAGYGAPTAGLAGQVGGYMDPTAGLAGQVGSLMSPTIGLSGQVAGLAPQVAAPMGQLQGAASSILQQGLDPQNALYDRTFDQLRNQTAATNAMSGIGNTPYGASTVDNALSKFNIDWQNNLLNRMATAGSAAQGLDTAAGGLGQAAGGLYNTAGGLLGQAGSLGGQAGNLYGQAGNLGSAAGGLFGQAAGIGNTANNIYGAAGNALTSGLNTANNMYGQAANTLGQGYNIAQQGLGLGQGATNLQSGAASLPMNTFDQFLAQQLGAANAGVQAGQTGAGTLGTLANTLNAAHTGQQSNFGAGFQNLMNSLQAPYNAQNTQGGNILSAQSNLTNLGNNQYLLPQQVLNDLQSYLHLGQSASQISGQLGALGQQQLGNSLQGLGSLAGTVGNPFSSSSSGLLGGAFAGGGGGLTPLAGDALAGSFAGDFGGGIGALGGGLADTAAVGGGLDIASALPAAALSA